MVPRKIVCEITDDVQALGCSGVAPEYLAEIPNPEQIVSCPYVISRLDEIWNASDCDKDKARPVIIRFFKDVLKEGGDEVYRRFMEAGATGTHVVRAQAFLVDCVIHSLMEFTTKRVMGSRDVEPGHGLVAAAVGGYGRGELSPHSDIDLLFLMPGVNNERHEAVVEYALYLLWDLGLKVGHSTRSIAECLRQAKDDLTVRTALLESRYLWGNEPLYADLLKQYEETVIKGSESAYIEQKLQERNDRHDRTGTSRYVLEPNVKEGKGGLRDLHTLFWIAKYTYGVDSVDDLVSMGLLTSEAVRTFTRAQNFLWTVRCHMHYLAKRAEDRLTFDLQPEIAKLMGYQRRTGQKNVERFMKHYFLVAKDVGNLTRMICSVLEEQNKRRSRFSFSFSRPQVTPEGFVIEKNRLNVKDHSLFVRDPVMIMRLYYTVQDLGVNIHPNVVRLITESLSKVKELRSDPEANRLFLGILSHRNNSETVLRKMNEAGVFARFFPEFGRVVAQMQYDMYHIYTTDEHTIRTIGIVHDIELGLYKNDMETASKLFPLIESRRALYVAMLIHDLAKGSGEDHSIAGARWALEIGPRFGLSAEETETVSWLVLNHLAMTNTAFKRDLDDPKAIADFANQVQSPERLRLLLILTCADIRGVGPQIWNAWKGQLLEALYLRTVDRLTGGLVSEGSSVARIAQQQELAAKDKLRERLSDWPEDIANVYVERGYRSYWHAFDPDEHERHARLMREADEADIGLTVVCNVIEETAHTQVLVYTMDHPGLFSKIAGAMVMASASVLDARIATFTDGMAVDVFTVQGVDGEAYTDVERLKTVISKALMGDVYVAREVEKRPGRESKRMSAFTVAPRILVDNTASATHTLVEINGRDRPGLLFDLASALRDLGLQINSAHISTYGVRVVDVFYVKDVFGMKITNDNKLKQIRTRLLAAIEPYDDETEVMGA